MINIHHRKTRQEKKTLAALIPKLKKQNKNCVVTASVRFGQKCVASCGNVKKRKDRLLNLVWNLRTNRINDDSTRVLKNVEYVAFCWNGILSPPQCVCALSVVNWAVYGVFKGCVCVCVCEMGRGRWYLAQCLHLLGAVAPLLRKHSVELLTQTLNLIANTHTHLSYTHIPLIYFPVICFHASAEWILCELFRPL